MQRNVFAYTADGADYPEFISVNRQDDGRLIITVRSAGPDGETAEMALPDDQLVDLGQALIEDELRQKRTPAQQEAHERIRSKMGLA